MQKFRYLFIVQGEGRGHMTQAITLFELLTHAGHEVVQVFIGSSSRRKIPDFFYHRIKAPIEPLQSPNFVTDKNNKSVKLFSSITYNAKFLGRYIKSLRQIDQKVKELKPDVIINFYDFLGGYYSMLFRPRAKYVCVGHQFLGNHPDFPFAEGKPIDKFLYKSNNRLNATRAAKELALSFMPYQPGKVGKMVVTPPLLRKEVFDLQAEHEDYLLGYMVNDGYAEEIMAWHDKNQEVKLHVFWDRKTAPEDYEYHPNLVFHRLDDKKFLDYMRRCKGLITTAGFESTCEALYLRKPVLMIPVSGQYEQACNALDAQKAQAGISDNFFNISRFLDYLPNHKGDYESYQNWLNQADEMFVYELTHFE